MTAVHHTSQSYTATCSCIEYEICVKNPPRCSFLLAYNSSSLGLALLKSQVRMQGEVGRVKVGVQLLHINPG